jgi:hypothetical protein
MPFSNLVVKSKFGAWCSCLFFVAQKQTLAIPIKYLRSKRNRSLCTHSLTQDRDTDSCSPLCGESRFSDRIAPAMKSS